MEKTVITPTVGRVVYYYPALHEHAIHNFAGFGMVGDGPLAAIVAHVHSDSMVNLAVFDANGNHHSRSSVLLVEPGDVSLNGQAHCEWMPYQIGQAAKTQQLQEQVDAASVPVPSPEKMESGEAAGPASAVGDAHDASAPADAHATEGATS